MSGSATARRLPVFFFARRDDPTSVFLFFSFSSPLPRATTRSRTISVRHPCMAATPYVNSGDSPSWISCGGGENLASRKKFMSGACAGRAGPPLSPLFADSCQVARLGRGTGVGTGRQCGPLGGAGTGRQSPAHSQCGGPEKATRPRCAVPVCFWHQPWWSPAQTNTRPWWRDGGTESRGGDVK